MLTSRPHVEPCSSTSFAAFCEWGECVLILKIVSLSCHDILGDTFLSLFMFYSVDHKKFRFCEVSRR